jgi:hypothetical protein
MDRRRWDGDERGEGVADAAAFVAGVGELLAAMQAPAWVAEDPDLHLLPHLRRACEALPLELGGTAVADGVFEVELRWTGPERRPAEVRAAVFGLVGTFAESASYVRERPGGLFDVVTGMLDSDGFFAAHGHTLRITVS